MIKCTNYIIKVPDLCLLWKALSIQGKKNKPQRSLAARFGSLLPPQRPDLMQKGSLKTVHSERTVTEFAYLCHREPLYICKQLQATHLKGNMIMPKTRKEIHILSNGSRPASCPPTSPGKSCACIIPPPDCMFPITNVGAYLLIQPKTAWWEKKNCLKAQRNCLISCFSSKNVLFLKNWSNCVVSEISNRTGQKISAKKISYQKTKTASKLFSRTKQNFLWAAAGSASGLLVPYEHCNSYQLYLL